MSLHYEDKSKLVEKVFNKVYDKYDLMNDIMSLGTHRKWKKSLVSWINPKKNPKLHLKIIEAMKKGNILIAEGTSNRGTETKDTYSLLGFTKAFKKVKDVCN